MPNSNILNWIIDPALNCVQYVAEETVYASVLHKSLISISNIKPFIQLAHQKFLEHGEDDQKMKTLIKELYLLEKDARKLIDSDFHLINSHVLIGLWCAVETAVEDTITFIFMKDIKAIDTVKDAGYKTKNYIELPLTEIEARKLYSSLEKQVRKNYRVGESYCHLLGVLGLDVKLDQHILDDLSEINGIRNCILHRRGIIDERSANESPKLHQYINKQITISNEIYLNYYNAVGKFAMALFDAAAKSRYMESK